MAEIEFVSVIFVRFGTKNRHFFVSLISRSSLGRESSEFRRVRQRYKQGTKMDPSALTEIARTGHRDTRPRVRQGDCDSRYRSAKSTKQLLPPLSSQIRICGDPNVLKKKSFSPESRTYLENLSLTKPLLTSPLIRSKCLNTGGVGFKS